MSRASFPVALHLADKGCLVVGSNAEAALRAVALVEAGARVRVVCSAPGPELQRAASEHGFELAVRAFDEHDLDERWLAVLTERDLTLGARMASAALARRVLFCAADQPQQNTYSHLALARAGVVTVAIGTDGRAPALGRRLREELARVFEDAGLAQFAEALAELRERTPPEKRREVLAEALIGLHFDGKLALPAARPKAPE